MRVAVASALRVGPGDTVVVRARLPESSTLGRLFVFAAQNGSGFAPYFPHAAEVAALDPPQMVTPVSLRLTDVRRKMQTKFPSDIDGWITVYQEVDTVKDPKVRVKLQCIPDSHIGWTARLYRKMRGKLAWPKPKP